MALTGLFTFLWDWLKKQSSEKPQKKKTQVKEG